MSQRKFLQEPRRSLALLLGAVILGIGALAFSLDLHKASHAALERQTRMETQARQATANAPARLDRDRRERDMYRRISELGFLNEENRTGWISALGQTRDELGLESLSWRLSPKLPSGQVLGLSRSDMDITLNGVSEKTLDQFLTHLEERAPGRFTLARCAINLSSGSQTGQAECQLNWWTWTDVHLPH